MDRLPTSSTTEARDTVACGHSEFERCIRGRCVRSRANVDVPPTGVHGEVGDLGPGTA